MTDNIEYWHHIAAILHEALPEIDRLLSQANTPISARKLKAFDIIRDSMLEVSDWKAFLVSEAHGRFHIIIETWFRDRYGDAVDSENQDSFGSLVTVHETPFAMNVPKNFKTPAEEDNMVWIAFPASVQKEEDPLGWIAGQSVLTGLTPDQREEVRASATEIANSIRSIGYDLRSLEYEPDTDICDLAGAVATDLQAGARHLCGRNAAGLRASAWDISQATEKALKLLIRRKGQTPPRTHNLQKLADRVEELSAATINRTELDKIPSNNAATDMRYGGEITLADALAAYRAALPTIRDLLFEAKPDTKVNAREARFKIQRPPGFDFDTQAFSDDIRSGKSKAASD